MGQQICKNCNQAFKGRPNKKFCSNSCKNAYHNKNQPNYYSITKKSEDEISVLEIKLESLTLENKDLQEKLDEKYTEKRNIDKIEAENQYLMKYKVAVDELLYDMKNFKLSAQYDFLNKVERF